MRRAVLAGAGVLALCGTTLAAQWVSPRPGQPMCSGWDTPEARDKCQAKEDEDKRVFEAARAAEAARTKKIIEQAQAQADAQIAARRASEEALRVAASEAQNRAIVAEREREEARQVVIREAQAEADAKARADAEDEFKRVDPLDAFVVPERYVGHLIKLDASCLAAQSGDYRCWSDDVDLSITAKFITPRAYRERLEVECSSVRAALGSGCRRTLRFTVSDIDRDKTASGSVRVILKPSVIFLDR